MSNQPTPVTGNKKVDARIGFAANGIAAVMERAASLSQYAYGVANAMRDQRDAELAEQIARWEEFAESMYMATLGIRDVAQRQWRQMESGIVLPPQNGVSLVKS
jgi:hypothetical protein